MSGTAPMTAWLRRGGLGRLALTLAFLALAMRALVPAGYMAAPAASGLPNLVICTGHGPLRLAVGPDGRAHLSEPGHKDQPSETTSDGHCAFAGAAAAVLIPPLGVWDAAVPIAPAEAPDSAAADQRPGRGLPAPPPPATGPPASTI